MKKTGVLLVNLGTPRSPGLWDVYRYLTEFLLDPRVIDYPWLKRQLLVRGLIVPSRFRQSAKAYQQIWTKEGSPLLLYGKKLCDLLQNELGELFHVELGMRYQEPSIEYALHRLLMKKLDHLIIFPLFPQYSSATTGSVHQKVMECLAAESLLPKISFIPHYFDHPLMIKAFCEVARPYISSNYDHFIFSFHGLPIKQIQEADRGSICLKKGCCQDQSNSHCYSFQCHWMMNEIAKKLNLTPKDYSICFQSRLGKEPWLQPYASDVLAQMPKKGIKRVLVFSPSFVCDCLETTFEIGIEYAKEFRHAGGEKLDLVPGLNDHPLWVRAIKEIVRGI